MTTVTYKNPQSRLVASYMQSASLTLPVTLMPLEAHPFACQPTPFQQNNAASVLCVYPCMIHIPWPCTNVSWCTLTWSPSISLICLPTKPPSNKCCLCFVCIPVHDSHPLTNVVLDCTYWTLAAAVLPTLQSLEVCYQHCPLCIVCPSSRTKPAFTLPVSQPITSSQLPSFVFVLQFVTACIDHSLCWSPNTSQKLLCNGRNRISVPQFMI